MKAIGRTPFEKAVAHAYTSREGLGGTPLHVGGKAGPAETVYLGVFRRDRLLEVGLFDEDIKRGQDWELNRRIRAAGGTVWFTPELVVDYRPRSSLRKLIRQFVATGIWRGELARRFTTANSLRYFVPPLAVLGIIATHDPRHRRVSRSACRGSRSASWSRPSTSAPGAAQRDQLRPRERPACRALVSRSVAVHPLRVGRSGSCSAVLGLTKNITEAHGKVTVTIDRRADTARPPSPSSGPSASRRRCGCARNAEHWTASLYLRNLSPYLTWMLLQTPITANGVTATHDPGRLVDGRRPAHPGHPGRGRSRCCSASCRCSSTAATARSRAGATSGRRPASSSTRSGTTRPRRSSRSCSASGPPAGRSSSRRTSAGPPPGSRSPS